MSDFLKMLKRQGTVRGRRWTIRRDSEDNLTEVKMIFNPDEYRGSKEAKEMYGDRAIIKILIEEKQKPKL
jgi:hypothetical protein